MNTQCCILTEGQRITMDDLFLKGQNHDGNIWVKFSDVEEAITSIVLLGFEKKKTNSKILFMVTKKQGGKKQRWTLA